MEPINLTVEEIDRMLNNFKEELLKNRHSGMTFTFKPTATKAPNPIIVSFSGLAWLKIKTLVDECSGEIGWQGTVTASDDRKHFTINDILVYPQTTSGANITVDEPKYEPWHQALTDEQYNTLRFQGHSHVNFGASPSGVDETLYNNMLQTLSDSEYYIFMIINKRENIWIKIYDLANNVIYDTGDINICVENIDLKAWYKTNYETYLTKKDYTYSAGTTRSDYTYNNTTKTVEEKKKLTSSQPKDTSHSSNVSQPSAFDTTATLLEDIENIELSRDDEELIYAYLCDPHYASDDPHVCQEIQRILNYIENQKKKKKQKGKPGRPPKYKPPIECIGCHSYRQFNPRRFPCMTCSIITN
jgi:hypothetical protein